MAALESGRTSWTAVLDTVRLGPDDGEAEMTAAQVRVVVTRLVAAGRWQQGDLPILVIVDAGYDPMRLDTCQLADIAGPATWPDPATAATTETTRYGTAAAQSWDRLHPRLTRRSAWLDHDGPLPVIEGTLIRLQVDHLPGDRGPKPAWLWRPATGAARRGGPAAAIAPAQV